MEKLQRPGGTVTAAQVDPSHAYWAMPRRVLLAIERSESPAVCDVCERTSLLTTPTFRSRPNGLNYPSNAWLHPLSPYRLKDGVWLPIRPNSTGLGYRHWLAWILGSGSGVNRRAIVIEHAVTNRHRQIMRGLRIWSFGYEMKKDNPICWHESSLPIYSLAQCDHEQQQTIQSEVSRWLAGAELAGMYLRGAVKDAWFSADARGDFAHIDAAFWAATEPFFYRHLHHLIEAARSGTEQQALPIREAWHDTLRNTALRLFDQNFVGAGAIERQNPRRIALAHKQLRNSLHGPKLRSALGLPLDDAKSKPARKSASRNNPAKEAA